MSLFQQQHGGKIDISEVQQSLLQFVFLRLFAFFFVSFQVSLTVLSASGLAKADVFGKSDPFAIVLLNRREVGRTRTLFKTLDPCWSEPRETFPLRIVGNRDRCSVAVQLWDEDLGEIAGATAVW